MSAQILLVTALDETHRKPLLESEGYVVTTVRREAAVEELRVSKYQLVLLEKEGDAADTIGFCESLKREQSGLKIVIIAQRADYVPTSAAIDAVIRQQHSPRIFLNAVRKLLTSGGSGDKFRSVAEGQ